MLEWIYFHVVRTHAFLLFPTMTYYLNLEETFLLIDIIEDTLASNTLSEKWGKKIKEKDPFQ